MTLDQEFQDTNFVRRQVVVSALGWTNLAKYFDDAARDFGRHGRAALRGLSHAFDQPRRLGLLQKIPGSSGTQRVKNSFVIIMNGQREKQNLGKALFE